MISRFLPKMRTPSLVSGWVLILIASPALALVEPDPARFEAAIKSFEATNQKTPALKDATLFVGASNIRRWSSLQARFGKTKVINRGFGGSYMSDVAHFADRIVIPCQPKQIYVNAGGNDLHGGKTPQDVLSAFEAFVKKVRPALPKAKISLLAIPPSPARWGEVESVKAANALLSEFCSKDGKIDFIDTFTLLLGDDGKPRVECYVEDKLHLSEAGYDIVTSAIKWQGAINALVKQDATTPPPANPIVFIGSSSIVKWKTLAQDFPGLPVMNRGFGGSEVFDSLTYAHRIVIPYHPRQVVFYAGGNDINAGKTPERVFKDFKAFAARVHKSLPQTKISFISIAGNPKRWDQVTKVRALNQMVESWVKTDPRLEFIDVFHPMLQENGLPKFNIFVSDQLHMNEKGYAIWKEVVGPHLK